MTPEEFDIAYPKLISWIGDTLTASSAQARSVASLGFRRLPYYFSQVILNSAKVVSVDSLPMPPLTKLGLTQFADFERGDFDSITYLDTFFVKQQCSHDEGLHFHELIHVLQWRLLGPKRFLAIYADGLERFGYQGCPLESMAYGAERIFRRKTRSFNAENQVEALLVSMRVL